MASLKIALPDTFVFTTDIPLRISDINYGGHLGNDAVLSLVHEARLRLLMEHGYSEFNIEGKAIIMRDAMVVYRSEAFYGEVARVQVAIQEFTNNGFDMLYLLRDRETGREIARVKTGILFFDYQTRKLLEVPDKFRKLFV